MPLTEEQEQKLLASAEKVDALESKNAELEKQVEGQEKVIQDQKRVYGEAKKELEERGVPQEVLDRMKKIEDNIANNTGSSTNPGDDGKPIPKTLEEMQGALSEQALENPALEKIWQRMSEEERSEVYTDPVNLRSFLQAAALEKQTPVPGSLIEAAKGKKPDKNQAVENFRVLFRKAHDESSRVPGGRENGSSNFAGSKPLNRRGNEDPQPTNRTPTGSISGTPSSSA